MIRSCFRTIPPSHLLFSSKMIRRKRPNRFPVLTHHQTPQIPSPPPMPLSPFRGTSCKQEKKKKRQKRWWTVFSFSGRTNQNSLCRSDSVYLERLICDSQNRTAIWFAVKRGLPSTFLSILCTPYWLLDTATKPKGEKYSVVWASTSRQAIFAFLLPFF